MRTFKSRAAVLAFLLAAALVPGRLAAEDLFVQLGDAADTGRLEAEAKLREGSVPVMAGYSVRREGLALDASRRRRPEGEARDVPVHRSRPERSSSSGGA